MEEQKFWNWFIENAALIKSLIDGKITGYEIYEKLSEKLVAYNEYVIPEITGGTDGNYILILSADGIRDGIEAVEKLYEAAPVIKGWVIQKFRQPGFAKELNYNGLYVKEKDIRVRYTPNNNLFNVEVLMKGYKEHDPNYPSLGLLYLDHFIGEYNVMTKIGVITFSRLSWLTNKGGLVSLSGLLDVINGGYNIR